VALLFLVGLTGPTQAQGPFRPTRTIAPRDDPLDEAREMAKAKARRAQGTAAQLSRTMLETAEQACRWEFERVGEQITADDRMLSSLLSRWREAEVRAAPNRDARLRALWRDWEFARRIDAIIEGKHLAGQTKLSNRLWVRVQFLEAQLRLAEARSEKGALQASGASAVGFPLLDAHVHFLAPWEGCSFDRWRAQARAKHKTLQATPRQLRQAIFDAAREAFDLEWERVGATITRDDIALVEFEHRMLAAEKAMNPAAADAVLQKGWQSERLREELVRAKYLAGQTKLAIYAAARYARLRHEPALARIKGRGQSGNREAPPELFPQTSVELDMLEFGIPTLLRGLARDRRAAYRADPRALDRTLYELAQLGFELKADRLGEQVTADDPIMAEWSDRLLETELALAGSDRERRAALERSWERALWLERITESRYRAAQTKETNYLRMVYYRLEAELRLAQMREKHKGD
jgi:hypothetical protein